MTRAVPEWMTDNDDARAPTRVRAAVVASQNGICACGCGVKLGMAGERIEIDHRIALILGGQNRQSNLQALRQPCHKAKTATDVAQKAKEARKRNKYLGLASKSRTGFRAWRRFNGDIVRREG